MVSSAPPKPKPRSGIKVSALLSSDDDELTDSIESDYSDEFSDANSDSDISVKSLHKTETPKSSRSVKSTSSLNVDKKSNQSPRSVISKPDTVKAVTPGSQPGSPKSARSVKSSKTTTPEKAKIAVLGPEILEAKPEPVKNIEPSAAINANPIEPKIDTAQAAPLTALLPKENANSETVIKENLFAALATNISNAQNNSGSLTQTGNKSLLGKRMQKLIENRRKGKNSKLPENYRGLGSTVGLEELERFRNNALNTELDGAKGQRKEIYLAWLEKKERAKSENANSAKKAEKEKQTEKQMEKLDKDKVRELARKAWEERKKEIAKGLRKQNKVHKFLIQLHLRLNVTLATKKLVT